MKVTFFARGSDGTVAIYTGDDDLPMDAPLSHLGRIKFHSSLAYPKVISEWSGTVNFPARSTFNGSIWVSPSGVQTASYTLFAHGLGGQPWVLGSVDIDGVNVAMVGSVPVQQFYFVSDPSIKRPWVRWVSLGADATNVYLYEYTVCTYNADTGSNGSTAMPALSLDFTVWVTDELLT